MTKLALIEIDKKHDCPVGQYEKGCFDGEGSGQCLQCGMTNQLIADQSVVDGLDKQIEALQQEVERLKGMIQKASDDNDDDMSGSTMATPEQIQTIIKNLTEIAERKAKLKAQSEYKEEAGQ